MVVPLIETTPVDDHTELIRALEDPAEVGAVVLSSASSVPMLAAVDGEKIRGLSIFAVGPATAAALEDVAIVVTAVADGSGGAALAELIGRPTAGSRRAVVLSAADPRPELAADLATAGWDVETVIAYVTSPTALSSDEVASLASSDAVAFASPSAVAAWVAADAEHGGVLRTPPAAAIGETTADAARAAGFGRVIVADDASDGALARAAVAAARGSVAP